MRMKGYPGWFYRTLLATMGALFVSGSLLIPTALEMKLEWEVPWRLTGDPQIAMAALHASAAFLAAAVVGALWSIHMRAGWKKRKNHRTGIALLASMLLLGITAIGIYYLGEDQAALCASVAHMLIGVLLLLFLAVHIVAGWRVRSQHQH